MSMLTLLIIFKVYWYYTLVFFFYFFSKGDNFPDFLLASITSCIVLPVERFHSTMAVFFRRYIVYRTPDKREY